MRLERLLFALDPYAGPSVAVTFARGLVAPAGRIRCLHVIDAHVFAVGSSREPMSLLRLREALAESALEKLDETCRSLGVSDARARCGARGRVRAALERVVVAVDHHAPAEPIHFLALVRGGRVLLPGADTTLAAGDELLLAASAGSIKTVGERVGLALR